MSVSYERGTPVGAGGHAAERAADDDARGYGVPRRRGQGRAPRGTPPLSPPHSINPKSINPKETFNQSPK